MPVSINSHHASRRLAPAAHRRCVQGGLAKFPAVSPAVAPLSFWSYASQLGNAGLAGGILDPVDFSRRIHGCPALISGFRGAIYSPQILSVAVSPARSPRFLWLAGHSRRVCRPFHKIRPRTPGDQGGQLWWWPCTVIRVDRTPDGYGYAVRLCPFRNTRPPPKHRPQQARSSVLPCARRGWSFKTVVPVVRVMRWSRWGELSAN